jgi:hypothetical protein
MGKNDSGRNLDPLAQDAKLTARADGYGPVGQGAQHVKTRPPAPAPMVKAESTAKPATAEKTPRK